jgi:hypothetical protein
LKTYFDKWLSKAEKKLSVSQGIQSENGLKLRVKSKDATGTAGESAIATTLSNRFSIPIDFELLNDIGPYHQSSLSDKLEIELTFNDSAAIILGSTAALANAADKDYMYTFNDIQTEWDQIHHAGLASTMSAQYNKLALPFKRLHYHHMIPINKTDSVINLNINAPAKSLTHILILTIDPNDRKDFQHNDTFKNLDIVNVSITIEGIPNKLYASGMKKQHTWSESCKLFPEANLIQDEFLTKTYALCFDLRPSVDPGLHGNGTCLENTTNGLNLLIERTAASSGTGKFNLHVFLLQDAQLNITEGRFHSVEY